MSLVTQSKAKHNSTQFNFVICFAANTSGSLVVNLISEECWAEVQAGFVVESFAICFKAGGSSDLASLLQS